MVEWSYTLSNFHWKTSVKIFFSKCDQIHIFESWITTTEDDCMIPSELFQSVLNTSLTVSEIVCLTQLTDIGENLGDFLSFLHFSSNSLHTNFKSINITGIKLRQRNKHNKRNLLIFKPVTGLNTIFIVSHSSFLVSIFWDPIFGRKRNRSP